MFEFLSYITEVRSNIKTHTSNFTAIIILDRKTKFGQWFLVVVSFSKFWKALRKFIQYIVYYLQPFFTTPRNMMHQLMEKILCSQLLEDEFDDLYTKLKTLNHCAPKFISIQERTTYSNMIKADIATSHEIKKLKWQLSTSNRIECDKKYNEVIIAMGLNEGLRNLCRKQRKQRGSDRRPTFICFETICYISIPCTMYIPCSLREMASICRC